MNNNNNADKVFDNVNVFKYKCDLVTRFNKILRDEYNPLTATAEKKSRIKCMIIESHYQDIKEFIETFNTPPSANKKTDVIELIETPEKDFYNIKIQNKYNNQYYFYADTSNPRFWLVHYIDTVDSRYRPKQRMFTNQKLMDAIYLTDDDLFLLLDSERVNGKGIQLKEISVQFEQRFMDGKENALIYVGENGNFIQSKIGFDMASVREDKPIDVMLKILKRNGVPTGYKSFKCTIFDAYDDDLITFETTFDGRFTVLSGGDIFKYFKFIEKTRDYYSDAITEIEKCRADFGEFIANGYGGGGLCKIVWNADNLLVKPTTFAYFMNKMESVFKLDMMFMFSDEGFSLYNCKDTHTDGSFCMQIFPNQIFVNLEKNGCGNVMMRLLVNLKRFFSPTCALILVQNE